MPITKWIEKEEDVKGMNAKWIAKYKAKDFSAAKLDDVLLFFGAMAEFGLKNKEYKQVVDDAIEQYREICQYYEIRGTDIKLVIVANENVFKLGLYTGDWKEIQEQGKWRNPVRMEMIPGAMEQIMAGNPNTDKYFFKGDLTVAGPIKLAILGREWVTTYYEENGIEID
jgi:hypothetical protein